MATAQTTLTAFYASNFFDTDGGQVFRDKGGWTIHVDCQSRNNIDMYGSGD